MENFKTKLRDDDIDSEIFDTDSCDTGSCSTISIERLQMESPLDLTTSGQYSIHSFPEVVVDQFDLHKLPFCYRPYQFVITKCTRDVMGMLLKTEFLQALFYNPNWKLYVPNLIYGYLAYAVGTGKDPWDANYDLNLPSGVIEVLYDFGKIVILKPGVPEEVELSQETLAKMDGLRLQIYSEQKGICSIVTSFQVIQDKGLVSSVVLPQYGEVIEDCILESPVPSSKYYDMDYLEKNIQFLKGLQRISDKFDADENIWMHLAFNSLESDKLVEIWYMQNLAFQFQTTIHVVPRYFKFIKEYLPSLACHFSETNIYNDCRFHYECLRVGDVARCLPPDGSTTRNPIKVGEKEWQGGGGKASYGHVAEFLLIGGSGSGKTFQSLPWIHSFKRLLHNK